MISWILIWNNEMFEWNQGFYKHGGLERVNLQKKMPDSDTYIFDMFIPLGIGKRPNENIRSMS